MNDELTLKIENLPKKPGVYIMYGKDHEIIYVGKAKILNNRVRQYFHQNGAKDLKTSHLVRRICDLDYIITDSEAEALMLECNMIKEHRPYYNILLKDDKSFPFIKLTLSENYPRLLVTRNRYDDKDKYYGPFINARSARIAAESINRLYPIQKCSKKTKKGVRVGSVCLYYHIGQCAGCCTGEADTEEYSRYTEEIKQIFSGKHSILTDMLRSEMLRESENLNFEAAAAAKDAAAGVKELFEEQQKVHRLSDDDRDIIAMAGDESNACIQLFKIREGKMTGTEMKHMKLMGDADEEILASFITQYYMSVHYVPGELVLQQLPADSGLIEELLSSHSGHKIVLHVPQKGDKLRLLNMAAANAGMNIENRRSREENARIKKKEALESLALLLGTEKPVYRIEAFDISNISGSDNVGAMVVFEDAKKTPKNYRKFQIRDTQGQDDYASMSEVIFRRLNRALEEIEQKSPNPKFLPLPEVIFVDGGLNHVNAAKKMCGLFSFDIAVGGLVKDKKHNLRAVILEDGREIPLKETSEAMKLLYDISEEVHRSAVGYHQNLRSRNMIKSELTDIEGIGKNRAAALIKHFGSPDKIKNAGVEQLLEAEGMNRKSAENVYSYYHESGLGDEPDVLIPSARTQQALHVLQTEQLSE